MAYWRAWEEPRAVGDLAHVEKFFARTWEVSSVPGPAHEGEGQKMSMYADDDSDEVIVPTKRSNKEELSSGEIVERGLSVYSIISASSRCRSPDRGTGRFPG